MNHIVIRKAEKHHARQIATLVMEAMNHDCCQWFAGPEHTLDDFHQLMTRLVERDDSQYSYRNTLVAATDAAADDIVGILVSYDGARLHQLRRAFIDEALQAFGIDYSGMDDETQAGELYLDSLCVRSDFRHMGIATALLQAGIERGRSEVLPAVGLLVDQGNPKAEHLYRSLGFSYAGDSNWGGHPMRHLVYMLK